MIDQQMFDFFLMIIEKRFLNCSTAPIVLESALAINIFKIKQVLS